HSVRATVEGRAVPFTEDFALKYTLDTTKDALEVLTYRDASDPGFFEASALLALPPSANAAPRTIVALFDTSLSMQWEKLERSFHALESLLRALKPADRFNVILYNDIAAPYAAAPVSGTVDEVEKALAFVRA